MILFATRPSLPIRAVSFSTCQGTGILENGSSHRFADSYRHSLRERLLRSFAERTATRIGRKRFLTPLFNRRVKEPKGEIDDVLKFDAGGAADGLHGHSIRDDRDKSCEVGWAGI